MNRDVMSLAEDDEQFKEAAQFLFGDGFKEIHSYPYN